MDTWRPVPTAYGVCSNAQSFNRPDGALSAIGNDSSAGAFIGKRRWVSVIRSWLGGGSAARRWRDGRQWAWRYLDGGLDGDLALLLAVRSQHDGIDWDRFADPADPSLSRLRQLGAPGEPAACAQHAPGQRGPGRLACGQYDGIDWDCARDQGERVP